MSANISEDFFKLYIEENWAIGWQLLLILKARRDTNSPLFNMDMALLPHTRDRHAYIHIYGTCSTFECVKVCRRWMLYVRFLCANWTCNWKGHEAFKHMCCSIKYLFYQWCHIDFFLTLLSSLFFTRWLYRVLKKQIGFPILHSISHASICLSVKYVHRIAGTFICLKIWTLDKKIAQMNENNQHGQRHR